MGFENWNDINNTAENSKWLENRFRLYQKLQEHIDAQDNPENLIGYIYTDENGFLNIDCLDKMIYNRNSENAKYEILVYSNTWSARNGIFKL